MCQLSNQTRHHDGDLAERVSRHEGMALARQPKYSVDRELLVFNTLLLAMQLFAAEVHSKLTNLLSLLCPLSCERRYPVVLGQLLMLRAGAVRKGYACPSRWPSTRRLSFRALCKEDSKYRPNRVHLIRSDDCNYGLWICQGSSHMSRSQGEKVMSIAALLDTGDIDLYGMYCSGFFRALPVTKSQLDKRF